MNEQIEVQSGAGCQVFIQNTSISVGTSPMSRQDLQGRVTRGRKNPLWKDLPSRLKWLRSQSGLNQYSLGLIAGIGNTVIAYLERGGRPKISTVERLAAALGVPACFLAFGERGERPFTFRIPREEQPLPVGAPNAQVGDQLHAGFAIRLTQARELRRISLRELSRRANISVTAVSNYERAINVPLIDAVEQLAVALDVSPCWLAYGTGDAPIELASDRYE